MPTRDVPREQWTEFLETFSRQHRAWLATVEQHTGKALGTLSPERPLAAVTPQRVAGLVSAIEISFAADSSENRVRVERPARLRLEQTLHGEDRALEIVDRDGMCTRLGFRTTAFPEMLDGVTPEEVGENSRQ